MMKRKAVKVGDLIRIQLGGGGHCFGRMYRDSTIGVYLNLRDDVPSSESFERTPDFVGGVFSDDFAKAGWTVCGNVPFASELEAWSPPTWKRDILKPERIDIYYRGEFRRGTEEEIRGLHRALMYKPDQLATAINKLIEEREASG